MHRQTDRQTTGKGLAAAAAAAAAMDELSAFPIDAVGIFSTARLHTNLQIDRTANS